MNVQLLKLIKGIKNQSNDLLTELISLKGNINPLSLITEELHNESLFSSITDFNITNNPQDTQTFSYVNGAMFSGGTMELYSIEFTGRPIETSSIIETGGVLSDLIYDEKTFTPHRLIQLIVTPEMICEKDSTEDRVRRSLHEILDRIIDNPDNFSLRAYEIGIRCRKSEDCQYVIPKHHSTPFTYKTREPSRH